METRRNNEGDPTSAKNFTPSWSTYRLRRPHSKSRAGCLVCKRRRIKCDETKPECKRCQLHGVSCCYAANKSGVTETTRNGELFAEPPVSAQLFSMSLSCIADIIDSLLQSDITPRVSNASHFALSTSKMENLNAFRHFELFTTHTLGAPLARHIIRTRVVPLAFSSVHLMHSVIALSMAHLRRSNPSYTKASCLESLHWERAIVSYQQELTQPIGPHNMDAIVSTCMSLTILAFIAEDDTASGSWIFGPPQASTNWLYVHGGLPGIMDQCKDHFDNCIWLPVVRDGDDHRGTFSDERPGPDGLPQKFVELCEIDEYSNATNNPYHAPLRTLAALLTLQPSSATFSKLLVFVGRVTGRYGELVQLKDARALLILSYWFALMCEVDQWWVQTRVTSECTAICRFLETCEDPRIQELLAFPARACGYNFSSDSNTC